MDQQALAHSRTIGSHAGLGCCFLAPSDYSSVQEEFARMLSFDRNRAGAEKDTIAALSGLGLADVGMADMAGAVSAFQEAFYRNWPGRKMTRPEALRQAQLTVKNNPRTSDPYYWAAFELIGDWQ